MGLLQFPGAAGDLAEAEAQLRGDAPLALARVQALHQLPAGADALGLGGREDLPQELLHQMRIPGLVEEDGQLRQAVEGVSMHRNTLPAPAPSVNLPAGPSGGKHWEYRQISPLNIDDKQGCNVV